MHKSVHVYVYVYVCVRRSLSAACHVAWLPCGPHLSLDMNFTFIWLSAAALATAMSHCLQLRQTTVRWRHISVQRVCVCVCVCKLQGSHFEEAVTQAVARTYTPANKTLWALMYVYVHVCVSVCVGVSACPTHMASVCLPSNAYICKSGNYTLTHTHTHTVC